MIESFRVENEKIIKLAECTKVPRLMIIAGSNGAGKSTLLTALKKRKGVIGQSRSLYISPSRSWYRQKVQPMYLMGPRINWSDIIEGDTVRGIQGLSTRGLSRYDVLDEAPGTIKHIIGQIEMRRLQLITKIFDQTGSANKENIPDIHKPLRDLISFFLPHLQFSRIDITASDEAKILFKHLYQLTPEGNLEIDIYDLSSGEREIMTLFLNFIEQQIKEELAEHEGTSIESPQDMTIIIDTPELHLHPALQIKLLVYMRKMIGESNVQFIVATHSPILINSANFDELFVLMPPENMRDYNQLVNIATEAERLETVRKITGETYSLTLGKPLVFIEGRPPIEATREPSDLRILELMCPEFSSYNFIPFHDKQRILSLFKEVSAEAELTPLGLFLFAILDKDRIIESSDGELGRVFQWPVCSIENFLLDKEAIWKVISPHRERLGWSESDDVKQALKEIALGLKDEELRLRVGRNIGPFRWHLTGCSETELEDNFRAGEIKYQEILGDAEKRKKAFEEAKLEIGDIVNDETMLIYFRGKEILKKFHTKYIGNSIMNYPAFAYQVAERIGREGPPSGLLRVKVHIDSFVPWSLPLEFKDLLGLLQRNLATIPLQEKILSDLEEIMSNLEKAVLEAKRLTAPIIDRKLLKEKCWDFLILLRQHIEQQPQTDLTKKVIIKINLCLTRTAAIRTPTVSV
ncbi:MAG: AAA family ATPase [Candidatus Bathyarchaeota archaeon]|nr:AAA family ATPase [Candidatus Bathyarchaeota archaeon]